MNVGQIFETHLGWAAAGLGKQIQGLLEAWQQGGQKQALIDRLTHIYGEETPLPQDEEELIELAKNLSKGVPFATPVFDGAHIGDIERLLEEAGGVVRAVSEFSSVELAAIYCDLFQRRWGFPAAGAARLAEVLELLKEFLFGSVLFLNDAAIAVQLVYQVQSSEWFSAEYVNGGVDPETRAFSPGSVLSFLNTQSAWEQARAANKSLRFSFGRSDREYKERWCNPVPVFSL